MAPAAFRHSALTAADPMTVWVRLQRAETWLGLGVMDTVSNEQSHGDRLIGFDWTAAVGGSRHRGTARVVESRPGATLALGLKSSEIEGTLTVGMRPDPGGTVIDVSLEAKPRGFLAGMFWSRISASIEQGLPRRVEQFARGF